MDIPDIFEHYTQYILSPDTKDRMDIITLHQALYRLFAFDRNDWAVLHASGLAIDNKSILFGDDGTSVGKTTQTLYLYKKLKASNKYPKLIGDEFILHKDGYLFANKFYPIHNKPSSRNLMESIFGKYTEYYLPRVEEYIASPVKLQYLICPHIGCDKSYIERITQPEEIDTILKATFYAHEAKLLNPALDRYSIFTKSKEDGNAVRDVRVTTGSKAPVKVNSNVCIYKLFLRDIDDLIPVLESERIL